MTKLLPLLVACGATLMAQTSTTTRLVRANGQGSISIVPDQVKINISVVTQAKTAQEAASDNATAAVAVQTAVKTVLGNNGETRTTAYTISPNYRYPSGGQAQLTGYTVTHTLQAVSRNTALAGQIIDAATRAGANSIGSLQFGLQDDSQARAKALTAATQQARTKAAAIATGLGGRLGNVVTAQEGTVSTVLPVDRVTATGAGTTATNVEVGTLIVSATVTVDFELLY